MCVYTHSQCAMYQGQALAKGWLFCKYDDESARRCQLYSWFSAML